ncbi:hypothetical protein F5Y10DRAFT_262754 [Nemania abortiva]|nr:hypothetical protein F5Y10DRAFT_262754 [Nemania abortiva]
MADPKPVGEAQPNTSSSAGCSPQSCWDELAASLDAVNSLDNFSSTKTYPLAANPVIHVGDNIVALPLTDNGAETIKKACKQAAAKNGGHIVLDTKVFWKLDSGQFRLANPEWPSFLSDILLDVCTSLSISKSVDAQLSELILCEKGSLPWPPSNETQDGRGRIATLAIYLPSAHKGGQMRFIHAGKDHKFDIADSSLFRTTALAWAWNATCAVDDIASGHRLILTYAITYKSTLKDSPGNPDQQISRVRQALHQCIQQYPNFSTKAYFLDHQYHPAGLSSNRLKGHDRAAFKVLKTVCPEFGLSLLLGRLRKQRTTLGDLDADDNATEIVYSADLLDEITGVEVARNIVLVKDQLINGPLRQRQLRDSPKEHKTANNSERVKIKIYPETAAIICPKINLGSYLYPISDSNFWNMARMAMRDLDDSPAKYKFRGPSFRVLEEIVDSWLTRDLPLHTFSFFIDWAWKKQHWSLFIKAISSAIKRQVDPDIMNAVSRIINLEVVEGTDISDINWGKYFDGAISHSGDLKTISLNLQIVENKLSDGLKPSFQAWKHTVQQHTFRAKTKVSIEDILYFLGSVVPTGEHLEWTINCIIPALRMLNIRTLRESIYRILEEGQNETLAKAIDIGDKILLYTYQEAALGPADFEDPSHASSPGKCFRDLLDICLQVGLGQAAVRLLDASWTNMAPCHANFDSRPLMPWKADIIRFLHDLGRLLKTQEFPYISSTRELFKLLIRRYMYSVAPVYPEKRPGWSRRPRGCGCEMCEELDEFLQSEDLDRQKFPEEYEEHFKSRLPTIIFRWALRRPPNDLDLARFVVYKTRELEFERDQESYYGELVVFEEDFEALRNDYMKGLLGGFDYRELIMLEKVKNSKGAKQLSADKKRKRLEDETKAREDKSAKKKSP